MGQLHSDVEAANIILTEKVTNLVEALAKVEAAETIAKAQAAIAEQVGSLKCCPACIVRHTHVYGQCAQASLAAEV